MEQRGCTRKAALRFLNRNREDRPKGKAAAAPAKVDGKQAAANDKPEATTMTPEERGKARAEGLRLFKLAGRPKKSDFIKVYGKRGHLMTWTQRAEAGIPAEKFQSGSEEGGSLMAGLPGFPFAVGQVVATPGVLGRVQGQRR